MPLPQIRLTALFRYPVKSCAATPLTHATLDAFGFRHDRGWMVVGARTGFFMTQREYPRMALIAPTVADEAEGALWLAAPGMPTLSVTHDAAEIRARRTVTVWRFTGPAEDCGDTAADWLSTFLHEDCRLVQTPPDWGRVVNPANTATRPPEPIRFVDGYPILLTSEASLADLNSRLDAPVPMSRFRPNLVIGGATAWAEDGWRAVVAGANGGVHLCIAKPSDRCAMTTVDQRTGEKTGPEPLRTLSDFRRDETGRVLFGMNLIADASENGEPLVLRVGDGVVPEV